MAKTAKKASGKKGGAAKNRTRSAAKQRSAAKSGAAQKRSASRKPRGQSTGAENWMGAVSSLAGSAVGREILAEVLEAAASALRKNRMNIGHAAETGVEQASAAAAAATDVATEAAAGAVGLAQTAAGVLAEVATEAARSMIPGSVSDDERDGRKERGQRGRRAGG